MKTVGESLLRAASYLTAARYIDPESDRAHPTVSYSQRDRFFKASNVEMDL